MAELDQAEIELRGRLRNGNERGDTHLTGDQARDVLIRLRRLDSLEAMIESADRFAEHDPGVDWPGGQSADPVDAICAALDNERELTASLRAAIEEDGRGFVQKIGNITLVRFAEIAGMPELLHGARIVIVEEQQSPTTTIPKHILIDVSRIGGFEWGMETQVYRGYGEDNVKIGGFIQGIGHIADELRKAETR